MVKDLFLTMEVKRGELLTSVFFSGKISPIFDLEYVPSTYKLKKKAKSKA